MGKLKRKDYAFLKALYDNGGEATVSTIREESEERTDLKTINTNDINYRVRKYEKKGWIESINNGVDENNKSKPKTIIITADSTVTAELSQYDSDSVDGYDSVDEAVSDLLSMTNDVESRVTQIEERQKALQDQVEQIQQVVENEDVESMRSDFNVAITAVLNLIGEDVDSLENEIEKLSPRAKQ